MNIEAYNRDRIRFYRAKKQRVPRVGISRAALAACASKRSLVHIIR